jgi:uncharacterized lipoprotein NlpE involved in copper resistance
VIDAATHQILQTIIRRESRSLLQYVRESFPWADGDGREVLAALNRLIREEQQAAAMLGRFLVKHGMELPYLGTYPMSFTAVNYVSLEHLLPQLVQRQRAAVAELEADLARVMDAEARQQIETVLEMKQRHLTELDKLASSTRPKAVAG